MSRAAVSLLLLVAACRLPPYDAHGKRCDTTHACPSELICLGGTCQDPCQPVADACSGSERPCITTLAGGRSPALTDGPPAQARFRNPTQLAVLPDGALLVADTQNHALRRVPLDGGDVTTLNGDGHCNDLDPIALCEPHGVAVGPAGELFVTALGTDSVLRIEGPTITRIVGDGTPNVLQRPASVAVANGKVLVTRVNYCEVRFYERDGRPATNDAGQAARVGGCGMLDGQQLGYVESLAVSPDAGTLYFADSALVFSVPLRDGLPSGPAKLLAGVDEGFVDGPPLTARFNEPQQLAATDDALYLADETNHRIRKLQLGGMVTTVAGQTSPGLEDGPASGANAAHLAGPAGVVVLGGAVYFTSPSDGRIRKIEGGQVSTVAGGDAASPNDACAATAELASPHGVDVDPATGTVYFTDTLHHAVRSIGADGIVRALAGGPSPGLRDGDFSEVRFDTPTALRARPDGGALIVADTGNSRLVLLDLGAQKATTLVGKAQQTGFMLPYCRPSPDGLPLEVTLCAPKGLAWAANSDLLFTDSSEPGDGAMGRLRADGSRVDPLLQAFFYPRGLAVAPTSRIAVTDVNQPDSVHTYDATGTPLTDILDATSCEQGAVHWERTCHPTDLVYVGADLYVLFEGASTLRKLAASGGRTTLIVGSTHVRGFADGAFQPLLAYPRGLSLGPNGTFLIADTGNHRIRLVKP